jgi:hypothetical protein
MRTSPPVRIQIHAPYRPSTETEIKFDTYRYYLQCLCEYLQQEYGSWEDFGRQSISRTQKLQDMGCFDERWIERFMKIAWNTEYLLCMGPDDPELIRISNQWTPVQAYFSVYASSEALAYALDGKKADSHSKALRKVTNYLVQNGMSPWNKAFKGPVGRTKNEHEPVNFPIGLEIPHNLSRWGVHPIEMVARCLKAEHCHRVDDLWGGKKRTGVYKYEFDPGYTGLLHFLYRLRIKSNYKEVDLFVAEAPEENIRGFARCIQEFCYWTLLHMEIMLIRKCTKRYMLRLTDKYLLLNPGAQRLEQRIEFYRGNM